MMLKQTFVAPDGQEFICRDKCAKHIQGIAVYRMLIEQMNKELKAK